MHVHVRGIHVQLCGVHVHANELNEQECGLHVHVRGIHEQLGGIHVHENDPHVHEKRVAGPGSEVWNEGVPPCFC